MIARIRHYVLSTLWAVSHECAAVMADVINRRHADIHLSAEDVTARLQAAAPQQRERASSGGDIAVLPLWGLISHRAHQVEQLSGPGGTSTERFAEAFRALVRDPSIAAIVIDINSPGGSVDGVPELVAEIRDARGKKPIVAFANSTSASAAYWLATAADEVVITPSGQVGSIGVFAAHEDVSKAADAAGVKMTLVAAGKFKVDGNPFEPLSDTARGDLKAKVESIYGMFVRDVAKNRGVSVDVVRNGYGEGRTLLAKEALAEGMVDSIETFSQLISRLSKGRTLASTAAAARAAAAGVPVMADAVVDEMHVHEDTAVHDALAAVDGSRTEPLRLGLDLAAEDDQTATVVVAVDETAADEDVRRRRLVIARRRQDSAA